MKRSKCEVWGQKEHKLSYCENQGILTPGELHIWCQAYGSKSEKTYAASWISWQTEMYFTHSQEAEHFLTWFWSHGSQGKSPMWRAWRVWQAMLHSHWKFGLAVPGAAPDESRGTTHPVCGGEAAPSMVPLRGAQELWCSVHVQLNFALVKPSIWSPRI